MRIAIVSDIHGNRTAFEAVLADLREISPDLIFHGGDLADGGSSPMEVVDHIRDLGWPGVMGNTDEMLARPESLAEFAKQTPSLQSLFAVIETMAAATREALGEQRLAWLHGLPQTQICESMALVHASPESIWRAPSAEASDGELESVYAKLGQPIAVYAHIHRPYIRSLSEMLVVNTGSAGLSYDGDRRAAYLLLHGPRPEIRRVEYDVEKEIRSLGSSGLSHADWTAKMLRKGSFVNAMSYSKSICQDWTNLSIFRHCYIFYGEPYFTDESRSPAQVLHVASTRRGKRTVGSSPGVSHRDLAASQITQNLGQQQDARQELFASSGQDLLHCQH